MKKTKSLKDLMDEAGATPYDLAPILGMTPPGVYKAINNENIKPRNYNAIANAIEEFSKKSLQKDITENTPTDMVPRKDYERLEVDYKRLEDYCKRIERMLQQYENGETQVKGKTRTA